MTRTLTSTSSASRSTMHCRTCSMTPQAATSRWPWAPLLRPCSTLAGPRPCSTGGLGFSMALNLVASVDRHGLRWHPNGTFGHFFLSSSSAKAFKDSDGCLEALEGHAASGGDSTQSTTGARASIFPEIPALEVAYAAYRGAVSGRGDEALQGIVGGFSGDQVFFMTLCYMTCTRPDAVGPHTVDCNKAVRSSEAFARAFHCPPESQMNPKVKCKFFR
ncbi:endothelin-converting enzyme 1-like [Dermacentor andersoni]|uniref:endothelin-converting enzyme 1-like n=1 Tax=Dermacentor andersoni TaxID=34620 RepID=UPI0024170A12|nr:endothelin-converting enzyme 1-like [Dermacentor andersoni]